MQNNKNLNSAGVPRPTRWNNGNQEYLGKDLYAEYLKSKTWKNKKKKYKGSGFPTSCWACSSNEKIEFHHRTYGRLGWEPMTDIIALCRKCHQEVTDMYNQFIKKSNDLLWSTTNKFVIDKRKMLSLNPLPDQLFNNNLIKKPHNVIHKLIKS